MKELFAEHGRPGAEVVLGDTAILERLDALHLLQRIFTQTQTGRLGGVDGGDPGQDPGTAAVVQR